MQRSISAFMLFCFTALVGCVPVQPEKPRADAKKESPVADELMEDLFDRWGFRRSEVRKLASEHVAAEFPQCTVLGTNTVQCGLGLYAVGVDLACKGKPARTVHLAARRFISNSTPEKAYWKFEPVTAELSPVILGAFIARAVSDRH